LILCETYVDTALAQKTYLREVIYFMSNIKKGGEMNKKVTSTGYRGKKNHKYGKYLKKVFSCCALGAMLSGALVTAPAVQAKPELIVLKEVETDITNMSAGQEPISHELTIYDAMSRAIKYNREHRLKKMESALAMQQRDKSYFDFLPELTTSAGYTGRNNENASSSKSYSTGLESLEPSISEDRNLGTSDITLSWSALDFGLSYARSQQLGDRYFIAKEVERKTIQNIISDVRREWWNAISAQRLLSQIDPFVQRVEKALDDSRQIESLRLESPLVALAYQRSLVDMLRTLESLRERLNQAKHRLISLMGTSYGVNFVLIDSETRPDISTMAWDVETMEKIALLSRPELMQSRYEDRITAEETRIALLGLIPDLNLNAGYNWDSNSYLVNSSWFEFGAQISWNLMEAFKAPSAMRTAEAEEKVSEERRLAVAMTIMMQVHFSKVNYLQSVRQFEIEELALSVENRILKQITSASTTEKQGQQMLIREQLNQLLAEVRNNNAYAELQDSLGRIFVSLGIDTVPLNTESMTIAELSRYLKEGMDNWQTSSLKDANSINIYLPATPQSELTPLDAHQSAQQESTPPIDHESQPVVTSENDIAVEGLSTPPQATEVEEITEAVEINIEKAPVADENNDNAVQQSRVVFTGNGVNIRSTPDRNSKILARASIQESSFPVLEETEGWTKVAFGETTGWVSSDYIEVVQ
jgi:outer membrane protein TolC